jgi:thymidylate synthase
MAPPLTTVNAPTLGECWLRTSTAILEHGTDAAYDGMPIREMAQMALRVDDPDPDDDLIRRLGDPAWSAWMHENFFTPVNVPELGDARSYASRLFDYGGNGRDQVAWVVDRLRADPQSRSATITTFEPLSDTAYIPCVSMLDFWAPAGRLELVVYAHSLDFGKKAYGNLVELARLQALVAGELGLPVGTLTVYVKSAHVYEPEWELMARLGSEVAAAGEVTAAAAGRG